MFGWQFVCLVCFSLWRMEIWANPTSRYYSGNEIYQPSHILKYQRANDKPMSQNATATLPQEGSDVSSSPEKNDMKRKSGIIKTTRIRRTPTGFSARGFHEEVFDRDFGHFSPVKRRPEADAAGFYGDTFSGGFGEFETMKRRMPSYGYKAMSKLDTMDPRFVAIPQRYFEGKRSPEMTKSGFHGDVFNGGFGEFHPM